MAGVAQAYPKQFLPLFGPRSTFQDTLLRVSDVALFERPIVITNTVYRFMVLEQLAAIGVEADVLLEPMRRDSGPAIAAGAAFAQSATAMPWCWRWRPITSSAIMRPLLPLAGKVWWWPTPAAS